MTMSHFLDDLHRITFIFNDPPLIITNLALMITVNFILPDILTNDFCKLFVYFICVTLIYGFIFPIFGRYLFFISFLIILIIISQFRLNQHT